MQLSFISNKRAGWNRNLSFSLINNRQLVRQLVEKLKISRETDRQKGGGDIMMMNGEMQRI